MSRVCVDVGQEAVALDVVLHRQRVVGHVTRQAWFAVSMWEHYAKCEYKRSGSASSVGSRSRNKSRRVADRWHP